MIVKNESECILTCLASVKDFVDYWVIVDTGSKDGTQQLILEFMKDVPGELHERPWVNFAHNRNEALKIAKTKADYTLFIDADEKWVFDEHFVLPKLDKDYYTMLIREPSGADHRRIAMVNNRLDWQWIGTIHETVQSPLAKNNAFLSDVVTYSDTRKGNRSRDPQKYLKDAKTLEQELAKDSTNGRATFFLAQSYANAEEFELALKYYEKRASMGGWDEEVFYSKYLAANMQERLEYPLEVFVKGYLEAHAYRPSRAEPLFQLAKYYIRTKAYSKAYDILKIAIKIPTSSDTIFVETWIYEWGSLYYFAECCAQIGKIRELHQALERLLLCKNLPAEKRKKVEDILSKASALKAARSN